MDPALTAPTLYCLAEDTATVTFDLLQSACAQRGVGWQPVSVGADESALPPPVAGDLLLMAGSDAASEDLARRLWRPGVASLQALDRPAAVVNGAALQAAGVRMPRRVSPAPRDAASLAAAALSLAAWPVLLRLRGGEGGRGVMRLDSLPSLASVRDVLGDDVDLVEYVSHALAWRVVIVGTEVVLGEAWQPADGDFRSNVGGRLVTGLPRPPEVDRMARAATALLELGFAGVDVMQADDGSVCVAEVNSPCFFADAQARSGVDVAGLIVEQLLAARTAA